MSSSNVGMTEGKSERIVLRVIGFGLIGAFTLAVAGGVEGTAAFYAFRAIDLALFPHQGAFVMTALSSELPIVLAVVGLLGGAIGMACFGNSRRAQENAKVALSALLRNALIGTALGVFFGGMSAVALGRTQSQEATTLFATFFAGVFFGFLLGLIISLILSAKRKPTVASG